MQEGGIALNSDAKTPFRMTICTKNANALLCSKKGGMYRIEEFGSVFMAF